MLFSAIVWDPPLGLDLGFFTLRYYSLSYLIAFGLGWYIMKYIYQKDNIGEDKVDPIFIYSLIGTLIGARLGHVIFYQSELFLEDPLSVFLPFKFVPEFEFTGFQGLASHGAAIGIVVAMYLYKKKILDKPYLWILDRVVIPVSIGGMFIRLGNFVNSEIVGKPTGSNFGVIFKEYPAKIGSLGPAVPRHPAQLYEAGCYLFIFFILWFVYAKTNKSKQMVYLFGWFLVMLWTVRFIIEFVKEPQVEERATWILNTGQLLSIPFIILGFYFIFTAKNRPEPVAQ